MTKKPKKAEKKQSKLELPEINMKLAEFFNGLRISDMNVMLACYCITYEIVHSYERAAGRPIDPAAILTVMHENLDHCFETVGFTPPEDNRLTNNSPTKGSA